MSRWIDSAWDMSEEDLKSAIKAFSDIALYRDNFGYWPAEVRESLCKSAQDCANRVAGSFYHDINEVFITVGAKEYRIYKNVGFFGPFGIISQVRRFGPSPIVGKSAKK